LRQGFRPALLRSRIPTEHVAGCPQCTPERWASGRGLCEQGKKRRDMAAAWVKSFRTYSLRHTCATLLLQAGLSPKVIQERLGHSSISTTLGTYSHVLPGMQEQATDKLAEVLR
jgi:integrase